MEKLAGQMKWGPRKNIGDKLENIRWFNDHSSRLVVHAEEHRNTVEELYYAVRDMWNDDAFLNKNCEKFATRMPADPQRPIISKHFGECKLL